eukprot:3505976-Rhodomonas_salina.3
MAGTCNFSLVFFPRKSKPLPKSCTLWQILDKRPEYLAFAPILTALPAKFWTTGRGFPKSVR